MAVRWAFSLGLHRIFYEDEDDMAIIFESQGVELRRNIWKSLLILDRVISTSMGRPLAISPDDFSVDSNSFPMFTAGIGDVHIIQSEAIDTTFRSSDFIGRVYCGIYGKGNEVLTQLGVYFLEQSVSKSSKLSRSLDTQRSLRPNLRRDEALATLHAEVVQTYSIVLLARPFFLYLLIKMQKHRSEEHSESSSGSRSLWRLSRACVAASTRTVALLRTAYEMKYLSAHNPLVMYEFGPRC